MTQWHRIDDPSNPPPMDGTCILIVDKFGVYPARWRSGPESTIGYPWDIIDKDGNDNAMMAAAATHWMHLPPPPEGDTND